MLEFLKGKVGGQYVHVVEGIVALAVEKGRIPSDGPPQHGRVLNLLDRPDELRLYEDVRQLLWQLIVQGILVPGLDKNNQSWPWFTVTEHGKTVIDSQKPQPYDPDGFLEHFSQTVPAADPVIVDYLEEGVRAFNYGCFKAAAVMIGAASEMAILLLYKQFDGKITDNRKAKKFRDESGTNTTIARKYQALKKRLDAMGVAGKLPEDKQRIVSDQLHGCFELIKRQRDAAGHPAIVAHHDPDTVFVNLRLMIEHIRGVYVLIDYFDSYPADW